jgi:hypothetical protein
MPALIPTPDDLERLTPAQRAKIRRYVARVALELDQAARDTVTLAASERQRRQIKWGEDQRRQARIALAQLDPEPAHITAARRQELLDNTR